MIAFHEKLLRTIKHYIIYVPSRVSALIIILFAELWFFFFIYIPFVMFFIVNVTKRKLTPWRVCSDCLSPLFQLIELYEGLWRCVKSYFFRGVLCLNDNAICMVFIKHCFSGHNPPFQLDPKELQYTSVFLPKRLKILGDLFRITDASTHFCTNSSFIDMKGFIARMNLIDNIYVAAITNWDVRQIIILGSGYDTRAYRFAHLKKQLKDSGKNNINFLIIELDQLNIFGRKRECLIKLFGLQEAACMTDHVTYINCSFENDSDLFVALKKSAFNPLHNTLYIMEGLTPYINSSRFLNIITTLKHFKMQLPHTHRNNHWIIFDALTEDFVDATSYKNVFNMQRVMLNVFIERQSVILPKDSKVLYNYLKQLGLEVHNMWNHDALLTDLVKGHEDTLLLKCSSPKHHDSLSQPNWINYIFAELSHTVQHPTVS